jgi:hypothetical protein
LHEKNFDDTAGDHGVAAFAQSLPAPLTLLFFSALAPPEQGWRAAAFIPLPSVSALNSRSTGRSSTVRWPFPIAPHCHHLSLQSRLESGLANSVRLRQY